jgi:hypothetical protein
LRLDCRPDHGHGPRRRRRAARRRGLGPEHNAVARTAGLAAVAALPLIAGLSGADYESPAAITDGFHVALLACAILSLAAGPLAWVTISNDVLETRRPLTETSRTAPRPTSPAASPALLCARHGRDAARAPAMANCRAAKLGLATWLTTANPGGGPRFRLARQEERGGWPCQAGCRPP